MDLLPRPLTWPEVESVETEGVEVVSDSVASPPLSSTGVGGVAFGVGPSHPQVGGLAGHKVVHLVNHQLVIPLLVLGRSLADPEEDVWSHAGRKREKQKLKKKIQKIYFVLQLIFL